MSLSTYITCKPRPDGAGALGQSQASVLLYARRTGMTYLHQPMRRVGHNYHDEPDWDDSWDKFFGIGSGEVLLSLVDKSNLQTIEAKDGSALAADPGTLYEVLYCHNHSLYPPRYDPVRRELREKFCRVNKLKVESPVGDVVRVAVHVRRMDVTPDMAVRYTPTSRIADALRWTTEGVRGAGLAASVQVFSEGDPTDLLPLEDLGAELVLDGPPRDAFLSMAEADVLITAKSSFSFMAGIVGRGITLHEPCYQPCQSDWIPLTDEMLRSDPGVLRSRLLELRRG